MDEPGFMLAVAGLLAAGPVTAQQVVGGQLVESSTRRPLSGAQVVLEGTGRGGVTDNRGRFLIQDVPAGENTLRVLMIGYREVTRVVPAGQTDLVIALTDSAVTLTRRSPTSSNWSRNASVHFGY